MFRFLWSLFRQNIYFVIGVILGLGLSLLLTPIIDNDCFFSDRFEYEDNKILTSQKDDDYEPRINLAGKPQKAQKTPQTLIRPRYFSTELGIKDKMFVGIFTKSETLVEFAIPLNKTVAHLVDKIMYFIDAPSAQKLNVSSLKLPGIVGFTDTRDILKPFHLLKYITDNFLEEFDFFFISRDTSYIRARELYDFVKKISVSQDVYAGTPVDGESEFCSLDAGILFSNSVLRRIQPTLEWCVKNVFSNSDSNNIGRCVLHATKIPCQQNIQGQKFYSFHLDDEEITSDALNMIKDQSFDKAITYFPIREPTGFYKLHLYLCKVAMMRKKQDIADLRDSLLNMSPLTPQGKRSVTWPIGNQPGNKPNNRFDVLRWDYFTESHIYLPDDFTNVRPLSQAEKADIQYVLSKAINYLERKYEGQIQYRKLVNGYRKFDPSRGMDYILDLAFRDNTNGKEVRKRIELCKPLGKVELLPIPYVTENTRVNLILPIHASNRKEAVKFIQQYTNVCMEKKDKTFLMLVFFYDPDAPGKGKSDDIYKDIKDSAITLSNRFHKDGSKIAWVSVKLPSLYSKYTIVHEALLDFAAADLSIKKLTPESLVLICRSNMEIRQDYLNRVRMNTILQWQVFCPIPFTEMNPSVVYSLDLLRPLELDINKNYGHFDPYNTKHISFYAKDYWKARKAMENLVPIVRNDKDILNMVNNQDLNITSFAINTVYSMFVRMSDLHVLRGVEPSLRLKHEEKICPNPTTVNTVTGAGVYHNCIRSQAFNLGTRSQLAKLILEYQSSFSIS